jgi:ATP phosphoribosyltransferase
MSSSLNPTSSGLTIAVPKGRMQSDCWGLLSAAGLLPPPLTAGNRSLLLQSPDQSLRLLLARPSDIPTYVELGAADLGLGGKDVLLEAGSDVYELADLGIGTCRFVLAGPAHRALRPLSRSDFPLRVATKFPHIAERFFLSRQWPVELVYLHGAVELAPNAGLADLIVDIVSTGQTLAENNLAVLAEILDSSVRLIANRASYVLKADLIKRVQFSLQQTIKRRSESACAYAASPISSVN